MTARELADIRAQETIGETRDAIQVICKLAPVLFISFAICDYLYVPSLIWKLLFIRLLAIPISFGIFKISEKINSINAAKALSFILTVALSMQIDSLILAIGEHYSLYAYGFNLVAFGAFCFLPLTGIYRFTAIAGIFIPYYLIAFSSPYEHHVELTAQSLYFAGSVIVSFLVRDINEELRLRELRSRIDLDEEVRARDHIISVKTKEILNFEIIAQKQTLIAKIGEQVAHDIRSPLTALNMALGSFTGMAPEVVQLIKSAINRINDIANALLDTSKESRTCTFVHVTLIRDAINSLICEKQVLFFNISFSQKETDCPFSIWINPISLSAILSNIIDNAAQSSGTSHVSIEVNCEENKAIILITDDGHGIPREVLQLVMSKGFTSKKYGHGLGLYTAKEQLQKWGAEIDLETSSAGTTVSLKFISKPLS